MTTAEELERELNTIEGQARSYEIYDELRAMGPVVPFAPTGGVLVTTHAACLQVLHSQDVRAVGDLLSVFMSEDETTGDMATMRRNATKIVLFSNPPDHTRMRVLLQKAFTPHLVHRMEPQLQGLLDGFVDDLAAADHPDVLQQVARQFPTSVIATVLGFPIEERNEFKPLADGMARLVAETPTPQLIKEIVPSWAGLSAFVRRHIERKRAEPDDALLSRMIEAQEQGDRLTEDEVVANVFALLLAGHDTTTNLIGNGTLALLQHRDQWDRLVADPSLAASAVEELLRFDAPFQATIRIAATELTIEGVDIPEGTPITVALASANRDPAVFPDANVLDITREPNPHLSFGEGIHYCMGNPLARVEGRLAFTSFVERFPDMDLDSSRPLERRMSRTLRGLLSLPVTLG